MESKTYLVQANTHTPQMLTCGLADHLAKNMVVAAVFFYRNRIAHEVLRDALKRVLDVFPLFAGTLTWSDGKLCIDCNNTGVRFSVTTEESTLDELLHALPQLNRERLVDSINPKKAISTQHPLLTIKLTYLTCGGMALGACWHHSLGDMQTFMSMMHAWAQTVNKQDMVVPLIVEDRDAYLRDHVKKNDNTISAVRYLTIRELVKFLWYLLIRARNKRELRFYFSDCELNKMKQEFSAHTHHRLSTNDVLCAHLFSIISAVDASQKPRVFSMAVNYRSKAQLPSNLLGNFGTALNILVNPNVDPVQFASDLRTAVDNFQRLYLDIFSTHTYIEQHGGLSKIDRCLVKFIDPVNRTLFVANWSKFGVYDIIFGESKPCFFIPFNDAPIPWISTITEGFLNRGLLYTVSLPSPLAKELIQEENLKTLHQYRDQHEVLPEWVGRLGWVL